MQSVKSVYLDNSSRKRFLSPPWLTLYSEKQGLVDRVVWWVDRVIRVLVSFFLC